MFLSIFTPTYNRGYILPRLYQSLCKQTLKDFEWVIVNDGSADDTVHLVNKWIEEDIIRIRLISQDNMGKSNAHNKGVIESTGKLFVCVDSDDYLSENAVEELYLNWKDRSNYIGILAFRKHGDGTPITKMKSQIKSTTLKDAYRRYGLRGDTMLVYRTEIIKKYQFPYIKGEKFIPEGYLYNKLDREGELLVLRKYLYICDYLDDGYTKNVDKLIYDNYKGYVVHINERIKHEESLRYRFLDSIRYDSVLIAHKQKRIIKNAKSPLLAFAGMPFGLIIALKRYSKFWK